MAIASFKLRRHDGHVWIMRRGAETGVTLRGDAAERAFELGAALFALASPTEPSRVRAVSVDLSRARLLATLEPRGDGKPEPVRRDGDTVLAAATPELLAFLDEPDVKAP